MARKEITVTIAEGRDAGRSYHIKEMGALSAEKWAMRAVLALMESGADIPEVKPGQGIEALASLGGKAILGGLMGIKFETLEPLMNQMLECVSYLPDPGNTLTKTALHADNCDNFIEDVATLFQLRSEVLGVHVGFSITDKASNFLGALSGKKEPEDPKPSTQTPQGTSELLKPEGWRHAEN